MDDLREQLKTELDDLPQLFGKLHGLLSSSSLANDLALIKSRFDEKARERDLHLISAEQADLAFAQIRNAVVNLIDRIAPTDIKGEAKTATRGLGDYHAFTCDRVDQSDHFQKIFIEKKDLKSHFFYLYGLDLQSHRGIFKRIAYDLEGRLGDYLSEGGEMETGVKSLQIDLTFDTSRELEVYKQNFLKNLFAALKVRVNEQEPLTQKDITWLRESSPLLQGLSGQDYVCVFVGISEWDWDKEITPEAFRWFISDFCGKQLPGDSPTYLFFFGIIYEEDDSPVEEEVVAALGESEHVKDGRLVILPELQMVGRRDIGAWFNKYSFIAPDARELKELRKKHFGGSPEHYMTDVENNLRKLIDQYNGKD